MFLGTAVLCNVSGDSGYLWNDYIGLIAIEGEMVYQLKPLTVIEFQAIPFRKNGTSAYFMVWLSLCFGCRINFVHFNGYLLFDFRNLSQERFLLLRTHFKFFSQENKHFCIGNKFFSKVKVVMEIFISVLSNIFAASMLVVNTLSV